MSSSHEVHLAIYDLSQGMARHLSAQFLGPDHALDIVPHTALLVYGNEYFFGRGIQWCAPHEFRLSRGINPVQTLSLGRTRKNQAEFEQWCHEQQRNGKFSMESYDLLYRNCNTFSQEAALEGLELGRGIPEWILEVPGKFLSSPMGQMVRPILEGMQLGASGGATPPLSGMGGMNGMDRGMYGVPNFGNPTAAVPATSSLAASNPWANISSASKTPTDAPSASHSSNAAAPASAIPKRQLTTPLLDKQTGPLLSTDTKIVPACAARLTQGVDKNSQCKESRSLLEKLGDVKATWTAEELDILHCKLQSFIESGTNVSFALMLLRLAVLKSSHDKVSGNDASMMLVTDMLLDENDTAVLSGSKNASSRSMAWCVLSNAVGSPDPPTWIMASFSNDTAGDGSADNRDKFLQLLDKAICDFNPTSQSSVSLRQSAAAFAYNVSRQLSRLSGERNSNITELSDVTMALLIGSLENVSDEKDNVTLTRRYLTLGTLLRSKTFGETAINLVKDLGLGDSLSDGSNSRNVGGAEAEGLRKEVILLLNS